MYTINFREGHFIPLLFLLTIYTNGQIIDTNRNPTSTQSSIIQAIDIATTDIANQNENNDLSTTSSMTFTDEFISVNSTDNTTNETSQTTEYAAVTTTEPYTTILTTTMTPETCDMDESIGFNVTYRTSSMFTAIITYNCSSINSEELFVFDDQSEISDCTITQVFLNNTYNSTVNVTCRNIQQNAGRNWTFTLGSKFSSFEIILNHTFTITLPPLSLYNNTNITVTVHDNLTSASIVIANCKEISDPQYLVFRCNSFNVSKTTLPNNCTVICSDLQPGSIYESSLVQLPIPIADKIEHENDNTFPQQTLNKTYRTKLDTVTNMTFTVNFPNKTLALISLTRPRGNYDQIKLNCSAQDRTCPKDPSILTHSSGNCSNCTTILISPIIRGVRYKCQTITIKENFANVTSNEFYFNTSLEPVIDEKDGQDFLSNTSHFVYNVIPKSDYDRIKSHCASVENQAPPCANLPDLLHGCSTQFTYTGIRGCEYRCYFTTKKENYVDTYSSNYTKVLYPPPPSLNLVEKGSRWISVKWSLSETAYVKYFELYRNGTQDGTTNNTVFSYNYTGLLPNQNYKLHVKLISNGYAASIPIYEKTSEAAPVPPSGDVIVNNIIPQDGDTSSTAEQYVIEIDRCLFSNEYGNVQSYKIYVRQDQKKLTDNPDPIGTYTEAMKNTSLDYFALNIPITCPRSTSGNIAKVANKMFVIIGNETSCKDDSDPNVPCNDKLKPNTEYTIIVSGCTVDAGCTSVRSLKPFKTKVPPKDSSKSMGWVAIFPILAVLIVVSVLIWKRRQVKSFYDNRKNDSKTSSERSIHYDGNHTIDIRPVFKELRPKFLIEYINVTPEKERLIYAEYHDLENMCPQYRQSEYYDPDIASYNRYKDIPARGPWARSAIYLNASHRLHDYINANEIKSFDNKKRYIATQGPLKDTCEDFWDMIIQYKSPKIVMLTRTEERNQHNGSTTSKCYPYFPTNKGEALIFRDVMVKVTNIEYYHESDLEIRHILIKHKNGIEHRVLHYFYTGWPDFGVVKPGKLLELIDIINNHGLPPCVGRKKSRDDLSSPIVVHCSAGVGRTGTYIAVDTIVRLLDRPLHELSKMKLDVMGLVYQLRQDRVRMVQTKDQYLLVYRCVEEELRRTRRLESILRHSNVYENWDLYSSTPPDKVYMNFSKSQNEIKYRADVGPPLYPPPVPKERTYSQRSNTVVSTSNGHPHRPSTIVRSSSRDLLNGTHTSRPNHDDHLRSTSPRRSTHVQSSKSQQRNT